MQKRTLGKTNFEVSEISLGTWQVGGKWGDPFSNKIAEGILHAAIDAGVNFIDTADVYSAGLSEEAVGRVVKSRPERIYVATKCGRQITPHLSEGYTEKALRGYVEDSLRRTGLERLDLIQLHCPPTEVYYRPEIFGLFERLREEGKIQHLGISVEKVEEALKGMQYDNVTTVQVIFNVFRQRPSELLFQEAKQRNVGIIVRVPLASGLLTGKFTTDSTFSKDDHRHFNRDGAGFDKGETFSGVDYDLGLKAMARMKRVFPGETNLAPRALQWILRFPEVSCVIPGASKIQHLNSNLSVPELPPLTQAQVDGMNEIYEEMIKAGVHQLW
ncbi:aldo/keto reductase [Neolewinella aurantiaca]|uniref:Aldo/keto reductase n=1 Tax=Neolewinella aurantiaca TaxID=2602767 RepID=A0A5C7FJ02_9BACT|nr:aldo/keto reductase [Neolewinella aurantiaca]TXF91162.1 aldo/keto reductase [Neolewinella aurantiaca]